MPSALLCQRSASCDKELDDLNIARMRSEMERGPSAVRATRWQISEGRLAKQQALQVLGARQLAGGMYRRDACCIERLRRRTCVQ